MITRYEIAVVWFLLSVPGGVVLAMYGTDALSYGETLIWTGRVSAAFLVAAVLVTPIRHAAPAGATTRWLLRHRRAIGVASFGYAALHLGVYIERKIGFGRILTELTNLDIATGWLSILIMAPLAMTSNNYFVRRMGQRWKRLHRSVHWVVALTFLHWFLATAMLAPAIIALGMVLGAQGYRLKVKGR